ncbi:GTPase IMAP family member 5-like [Littorina saxatilis]|uniref:AIG1-type G domain-containing protein n=1 Tax=Littorina saxatilis TaxID=31220 RepID=A0AAN9GQM3_9CAEN
MTGVQSDYHVVVMGKTGSGKSATCNRLLGSNEFTVYRGMTGRTETVQRETVFEEHTRLHVIDTPDVFNLTMDEGTAIQEFRKWENYVTTGRVAFLLTVRLDVRFTPTDYNMYKRYRSFLPRNLRDNIVLAFTRVHDLEGDILDEVKLSTVNDLLKDARGRHVTFSKSDRNTSESGQNKDKIMNWMREMPQTADGPLQRSSSMTDIQLTMSRARRSASYPDLRSSDPHAGNWLQSIVHFFGAVRDYLRSWFYN